MDIHESLIRSDGTYGISIGFSQRVAETLSELSRNRQIDPLELIRRAIAMFDLLDTALENGAVIQIPDTMINPSN